MSTVPTTSRLTQTDAARLLELMEAARLAARDAAIAGMRSGGTASPPELDADGAAIDAVRQAVTALTMAPKGGRR